MVAIIDRGVNIFGAISYNHNKVEKEKGTLLLTHRMQETPDGKYTIARLIRSFEPYLIANQKTEKPVLHISINPDPKDKVSDEDFKSMAKEYMQQMGYSEQPFVVFKHMDTDRVHVHIVSVCIDETGRKISDKFEKRRSMDVCRSLEKKYKLIPAINQQKNINDKVFHPVNYQSGDIKSQMASVLRHINRYYHFTNLGTYNALLSLYNIKAEEVSGELYGKFRHGIVYAALDENGNKASHPVKASLFGKQAGYEYLQTHYANSKEHLKNSPVKDALKISIMEAIKKSGNETMFKQQLSTQGIDTVIRSNEQGRIYGITFIDHRSKTVWNGSQLGKGFSANVFNDWWKQGQKPDISDIGYAERHKENIFEGGPEQAKQLFDFLDQKTEQDSFNLENLAEALGGLLPIGNEDRYEEQEFENRARKKIKKARKKRP